MSKKSEKDDVVQICNDPDDDFAVIYKGHKYTLRPKYDLFTDLVGEKELYSYYTPVKRSGRRKRCSICDRNRVNKAHIDKSLSTVCDVPPPNRPGDECSLPSKDQKQHSDLVADAHLFLNCIKRMRMKHGASKREN